MRRAILIVVLIAAAAVAIQQHAAARSRRASTKPASERLAALAKLESEVRRGDAAALASIRETAERGVSADVRAAAIRALAAVDGEGSRPAFGRVFHDDPDPQVRGEAARALAVRGGPLEIEQLVQALSLEKDPLARDRTFEALAWSGTARAAEFLLATAKGGGQDANVAAKSLAQIRAPAAASLLLAAVSEGEPQPSVIAALGHAQDPRSVPTLIGLLERSRKPEVRAAAAIALGEIGDQTSFQALQRCTESSSCDSDTADAARRSLARTNLTPRR